MESEKQKEIRKRRFLAGFKNPKKDKWARRKRTVKYFRKPKPIEIPDKPSNVEIVRKRPSLFQRIIYWFKSLWIEIFG